MKIFSLKDSSQAAFIVLIVRMTPLFRNFAWPEIVTPNFEHPQNLIFYGKQTKQCDDEILTLETKSRSRRGYTCGHDGQNGRSVSPSKHHDARRTQLMKGVEKAEWYVLRRCFVRSIEFQCSNDELTYGSIHSRVVLNHEQKILFVAYIVYYILRWNNPKDPFKFLFNPGLQKAEAAKKSTLHKRVRTYLVSPLEDVVLASHLERKQQMTSSFTIRRYDVC